MTTKIGYQWYINYGCEQYVPEEKVYTTIADANQAIMKYLAGTKIPLSACGLDKVEDDDGSFSVLEQIIIPQETYWEDE